MNFMDIASIRKEYLQGGLRRCQMPDDPLVVFEEWLGEAVEARLVEPTAMVVATVSQECRPSTRTVLLKGLEEGRFVFFTNYESRKGLQIETNPCVSLSFLWYGLERQVHIEVGQPHRRDSFAAKPGDRKPDRTDAGIRAHA